MSSRIFEYLKFANEQSFATPSFQDEQDLKILMQRIIKALQRQDILMAIKTLGSLDGLLRTFDHQSFEPDFYDFISDGDIWSRVNTLKAREMKPTDETFLQSLGNLLEYFMGEKLFVESSE